MFEQTELQARAPNDFLDREMKDETADGVRRPA